MAIPGGLGSIIGPVVGVAGIAAAWWRNRGVRRELGATRDDLRSARDEQREQIGKVLEWLRPALGHGQPESGADPRLEGTAAVAWVGFTDVTNDGKPELLVAHHAGPRASVLRVFGSLDLYTGFEELGQVGSDYLGGFDVGDFDGDGNLEIATLHADLDRGENRSMHNAVRVETYYRWDGCRFAVVGEGDVDDPLSGQEPSAHYKRLYGRPSWALN
jgi:hypothetical protein